MRSFAPYPEWCTQTKALANQAFTVDPNPGALLQTCRPWATALPRIGLKSRHPLQRLRNPGTRKSNPTEKGGRCPRKAAHQSHDSWSWPPLPFSRDNGNGPEAAATTLNPLYQSSRGGKVVMADVWQPFATTVTTAQDGWPTKTLFSPPPPRLQPLLFAQRHLCVICRIPELLLQGLLCSATVPRVTGQHVPQSGKGAIQRIKKIALFESYAPLDGIKQPFQTGAPERWPAYHTFIECNGSCPNIHRPGFVQLRTLAQCGSKWQRLRCEISQRPCNVLMPFVRGTPGSRPEVCKANGSSFRQ